MLDHEIQAALEAAKARAEAAHDENDTDRTDAMTAAQIVAEATGENR